MYAIEIEGLNKSFKGLYAVSDLSMKVPVGSIYGFIGENGSGKSTTEKLICGHLVKDSGTIKLFGKDYNDPGVRGSVGALIENAGCFPNSSVYTNLMMQALNLSIKNPKEEISRVLKIVRMEDNARIKFKNCSLGMKQRVGIALALLGDPKLLILDEPINGLDTDGMKIMREILVDITTNYNTTVLISSHILGELEKIATHYGIIKEGHLIKEIKAEEMDKEGRVFIKLKANDMTLTQNKLKEAYKDVILSDDYIFVYDEESPEKIVDYLMKNNIVISEIEKNKVGLLEYYIKIMEGDKNE